MLKSVKGVTYQVPDLDKARSWYTQILGIEPVVESSASVHFPIGDTRLVLVAAANPVQGQNVVAYWWVDDIQAVYQRLLDNGATPHTPISVNRALNANAASVLDVAGNILGILGKLPEQPSASAMNVAICRAVAAHDPREAIRGRDTLAEVFLGEESKKSLKDPATHVLIRKKLNAFSPGAYEFFMARTAYLDNAVEQALRDNIPQIVFLGAGYDTRALRCSSLIRDTRIFELDSQATQDHKRAQLEQSNVPIPAALTFVPIDFTRDDLGSLLASVGYEKDKKALFIWEGVTYYLPPQTVDATFAAIRDLAPAGSSVCFDYMMSVADMEGRFGAKQARDAMMATYTAEPLQFDLATNDVEAFLAARGYRLVEHLKTEGMASRYLTLPDGTLAGDVLDLFGLVRAEVL